MSVWHCDYVTGLIMLLYYSTFNLVSHNQPFASETCVTPTNKIILCSMTLILNSVITKKSILYDKSLLRNGTSKCILYSITNYCQWEAGIDKGQNKIAEEQKCRIWPRYSVLLSKGVMDMWYIIGKLNRSTFCNVLPSQFCCSDWFKFVHVTAIVYDKIVFIDSIIWFYVIKQLLCRMQNYLFSINVPMKCKDLPGILIWVRLWFDWLPKSISCCFKKNTLIKGMV